MSQRRGLTRYDRIKKNREEWERYGPAILELMDRLDKLEAEARRR